MIVGFHRTNPSKSNQGFQRSKCLNPQLVIPPLSGYHYPSPYWSLPKISRVPECFSNQGSRTSNSTHNCFQALEHLSNQGSETSNSTHQVLYRIFPAKALGLVTQPNLLQDSRAFFQQRIEELIT